MKISRGQILWRGLAHRCPNCGAPTLFRPRTLFQLNRECPACGLPLERDEGFFLGSMALNYGVIVIGFFVPVALLAIGHVISMTAALTLAAGGAILGPVLFYRSSRSWWLANYYFFLPHHLPANQRGLRPDEDKNT
jgi:uncharacterized protein (DUF983 family)